MWERGRFAPHPAEKLALLPVALGCPPPASTS